MIKNFIRLLSPAKVNLYLKIINKRKDNYHNIFSIFHTINLYDEIYIKENKFDKFQLKIVDELSKKLSKKEKEKYSELIKCDEKNLIFKALNKMRTKYKINKFYEIKLLKRIPIGGGLGGGSSNAAQIIKFINKYEKLKLRYNDMIKICSEIGADVPYFIKGGLALVFGIGDRIINYNFNLDLKILLIYPKINTSTKAVYENFKFDLTKKNMKYKIERFINKKEILIFLNEKNYNNDLEKSCFELYPELKELKETIIKNYGFEKVFLTGSGSTMCVILGEKRKESDRQLKTLKKEFKDLVMYETFTSKVLKF